MHCVCSEALKGWIPPVEQRSLRQSESALLCYMCRIYLCTWKDHLLQEQPRRIQTTQSAADVNLMKSSDWHRTVKIWDKKKTTTTINNNKNKTHRQTHANCDTVPDLKWALLYLQFHPEHSREHEQEPFTTLYAMLTTVINYYNLPVPALGGLSLSDINYKVWRHWCRCKTNHPRSDSWNQEEKLKWLRRPDKAGRMHGGKMWDQENLNL